MLSSNGILQKYHNFDQVRQIHIIHAIFDPDKDINIDIYAKAYHNKEFLFKLEMRVCKTLCPQLYACP